MNKLNCFICPHGKNTQLESCDQCWEEGLKEYLRSDKHKANLKKDLKELARRINGRDTDKDI